VKSILDRSFRYTPAAQSTPEYLRAKFQKIRKQLEAQKVSNVAPLKRAKS
jgi:hypothetical protein